MILGLSVIVSACLFLGLSAYKAYQYAHMPLHGRMELYPVPLEKERHIYGGSYMEEPQWWNKPRQISKTAELMDMLKEMLFIKKLFVHQRSLWWASYTFHLGIYFLIAWTFLLITGALTDFAGSSVNAHQTLWTAFLFYLTIFTGLAGFFMTAAGAGLLLFRRIFDPVLKKYTTPQEYFNLVLLLAALLSGIIVWSPDLTFETARQVMADVMTLSLVPNTALIIHFILLEVTFIYIPLSKMGHYVGKYFSFHKVLWENEPNLKGSEMERKIKNALGNQVNTRWSAPHMQEPSAKIEQ